MPTVLFRCPITAHNVQGWIPDDARADPPHQMFVSLRCNACGQTHAVNPATAEVLGTGRNPKR
jgi:hypothetical protein